MFIYVYMYISARLANIPERCEDEGHFHEIHRDHSIRTAWARPTSVKLKYISPPNVMKDKAYTAPMASWKSGGGGGGGNFQQMIIILILWLFYYCCCCCWWSHLRHELPEKSRPHVIHNDRLDAPMDVGGQREGENEFRRWIRHRQRHRHHTE